VKRILFITTSFENGAIPNVLLDLAPFWRDWGWDCQFLALEPLPEDHGSVRRCRALGFPLHSLNVGPKAVFGALLGLRKAIRELKPDLISTHLGRADIYTPWVKGKVLQITTHHSVKQNAGRLTKAGYRLSDRRVAVRTGVSQACNDSFLLDGFLRTPHSVIYNPVDPARLVPHLTRAAFRQAQGLTEDDRVLAVVGRLIPAKGHEFLLQALKLLPSKGYSDLKVIFAGEGPLRAELEARVAALGLTDSVRFLGAYVPVADVYQAADALVFPSLWEGMGLVILEAWCLGCPVAASALPAVKEFMVDGENGVLFEPADAEALAAALVRLLEDKAQAKVWAQRGRALVAERFSPLGIAKQYSDLFHTVLGDTGQP